MGGEGTVRVVLQVWLPPPPLRQPPVLVSPGPYLSSISQKAHCLLCPQPPPASLPQATMSVSSFAKQQMQFKCEECR